MVIGRVMKHVNPVIGRPSSTVSKPTLFGTLAGASLERYNHLGITARRGRVHHGGYAFKAQSDT
jgi:hypothetical protein